MVKERIFGYDALKAISAFLVVLFHVYSIDYGYKEGEYYYPTTVLVLWLFTACSVPLFFMINGALTIGRSYSFKTKIIKSLRLLFIGVFWGLVLKLFYVVRYQDFSVFNSIKITRYWFFFALAWLSLLPFLLNKVPKRFKIGIIIGLLIFPFFSNFVWDLIIFIKPSVTMPSWGHSGFCKLYGLVYLYAGHYVSHFKYRRKLSLFYFLVGLSLLAFEATAVINYRHEQLDDLALYSFPTIGALLLSIAIFMRIKVWNPKSMKIRQLFVFLGNNSMGIYIIHILLLVVVRGLIPELQTMTFHPIIVLLIALAYTLISAVISELIRRSPLAFLMRF